MPVSRSQVLILGHGEMGRSMEKLLAPRHDLCIWDRNLDTWQENIPLEEAAQGRAAVFFTLPSNPHAELAKRLLGHLPPEAVCISIAKGLDETGRTPAQVFETVFGGQQPYALLYGPMIAEELRAGRTGFAMLGCVTQAIFNQVQELFADTPLHLRHTTDITGISWAVILKNVYVPLIGAADALQLGDNARGFLLTAALEELNTIVQRMGGRAGTACSVAGLGDLITTATSAGSHHRQIGVDLVAGRFDRLGGDGVNIRGEGIHTLRMVREHQLFPTDDLPLYRLIEQIVNEPREIAEKFAAYFAEHV